MFCQHGHMLAIESGATNVMLRAFKNVQSTIVYCQHTHSLNVESDAISLVLGAVEDVQSGVVLPVV